MGTFAGTAIIDYRLSFADQEKQNLFSVSICSKQMEVAVFVSFVFRIYIYIYI
jgi:hypothetical protein